MKNKEKKWNWGLVGKADAIRTAILNRFRHLTDKIGLDWAFLEWLASPKGAPDSLFVKVLGDALNAWQASMATERNQERLLELEYVCTREKVTQIQASIWCQEHGDGWRISALNDLAKLRSQGIFSPSELVCWVKEEDSWRAVIVRSTHEWEINIPDDGLCVAICVREGSNQYNENHLFSGH